MSRGQSSLARRPRNDATRVNRSAAAPYNEFQAGELAATRQLARWRDLKPRAERSTKVRENATKLTPELTGLSGRGAALRASRFSNRAPLRDLATHTCGVSLPETTNGGTGRRKSLFSNV